MYYLGLFIFVYFFSAICGLISALIIRLIEKIILPSSIFLKLQIKRMIKEELKSSDNTTSQLIVNPIILKGEDFITGVLRGVLVAFVSFKVLGFLISFQNEIALSTILIAHTIIIIRNWNKDHRISDEVIIWSGDFLGIILVFFLLLF